MLIEFVIAWFMLDMEVETWLLALFIARFVLDITWLFPTTLLI